MHACKHSHSELGQTETGCVSINWCCHRGTHCVSSLTLSGIYASQVNRFISHFPSAEQHFNWLVLRLTWDDQRCSWGRLTTIAIDCSLHGIVIITDWRSLFLGRTKNSHCSAVLCAPWVTLQSPGILSGVQLGLTWVNRSRLAAVTNADWRRLTQLSGIAPLDGISK